MLFIGISDDSWANSHDTYIEWCRVRMEYLSIHVASSCKPILMSSPVPLSTCPLNVYILDPLAWTICTISQHQKGIGHILRGPCFVQSLYGPMSCHVQCWPCLWLDALSLQASSHSRTICLWQFNCGNTVSTMDSLTCTLFFLLLSFLCYNHSHSYSLHPTLSLLSIHGHYHSCFISTALLDQLYKKCKK